MPTLKKFHQRKHEKSEVVFPSFASLWRHKILCIIFCIFVTTTRACVSEARLRHPLVWNSNNTTNCFKVLCPTYKLFLEILGHIFGDRIQKMENLPYGWLTHWKWATMVAKIRPVRVTRGGWCCARLTHTFFKACAITWFRNQFARGQKTIGSHLNHILSQSYKENRWWWSLMDL